MAWHLLDRCIVFYVLLDNWSIHRHLLDNDIGPRLLELGASWSVLARGQGLRRLDRLGVLGAPCVLLRKNGTRSPPEAIGSDGP